MPRFNDILNNFINGEVSPKMYGRTDSDVYKRSCRNIKNMIVHPQGGVSKRMGTQMLFEGFVDASDYDLFDTTTRIFPFYFDVNEKYLIFLQYLNTDTFNFGYYKVDDESRRAGRISASTLGYPGQPERMPQDMCNITNSGSVNIASDKLHEIQYVQVGAYGIFTHPDIPPFVVHRLDDQTLRMGNYHMQFQDASTEAFGPIPFQNLNLTDTNIVATGTTGSINLVAEDPVFDADHVNSVWAFQDSGVVGVVHITAFNSTQNVDVDVLRTLPSAVTGTVSGTGGAATYVSGGTVNWYESAWSDHRGWPRSVAYLNGSLYFGGNKDFPNRIWKSQTNDIFEMTNETVLDPGAARSPTDPFYDDIAVIKEVGTINWLSHSGRDLIVGTQSGEFAVPFFEEGNVDVKPQTNFGSEYIQPTIAGNNTVHVRRGFRKLGEIFYNAQIEAYDDRDLTILADHIARKSKEVMTTPAFNPKLKQLEYQSLDNSILWAIDDNGLLIGATKSKEGNVVAFHHHILAGDGEVLSMAALPSKNLTYDELYILVKRTINSTTKIFLEKLGKEFTESSLDIATTERDEVPVFMDAAKIFVRETAANFYANLYNDANAEFSDGTGTGTETGTIDYSERRAGIGSGEYISWDGTSNADFAQVGTIRLSVRPDSLAFNGTLFCIAESGTSDNNLIRLRKNGSALHLTINDSAGTAIINDVDLGDVINTFDTTYDKVLNLELNYDITTGATRLFLDGVQFGTTQTDTGSRDTNIDLIRIGANYDGSDGSYVATFSNLSIFNTVSHTANYNRFEHQPLGVTLYDLDYLEGESVSVVADGNYVNDFTVSGGQIADIGADYTASSIIVVGLKFEHLLETQPIDAGSAIGSAQGSIKRIDRAVVRFRESAACQIGWASGDVEDIIFRDPATPLSDAIDLVTDDKVIEFNGDYDRLARVFAKGSDPLPCNITCIAIRGYTGDV